MFTITNNISASQVNELMEKCSWDYQIRTLQRTTQMLKNSYYYCAHINPENNSQIISFVRIFFDGYVTLVQDLIVDPNFRGKGLGKELMKHIELFSMNNKDIEAIWLVNQASFNFYEHIGYKATELKMYFKALKN